MRLVNRPLAVIPAAALAVGAIIVIIEVIAFAVHHGPVVLHWTTWYRWAGKTRWDQLVIRVWSAVLIVIGAGDPGGGTQAPPRHPPAAALRERCHRRCGDSPRPGRDPAGGGDRSRRVSAAVVTVRRRRARVSATAAARGRAATEALRQPVTQVLQDRLDGLDLCQPPRLKVRVYSRSR
jgi:hypothetical protein